ncbi:MAG TPA: rhomboid family intramembrane serine protease [Cyclobacteriaceae bacterium]|nr:rhomboid family intramembrane serine protease [Cyclobacteriaceae bacterium]
MQLLKKMPATLALIAVNCIVYAWVYSNYGGLSDAEWNLGLLDSGALYPPYVFNGDWYRLFSHMFLHGHLFHLLFNMYGLLVVGQDVEANVGTKKFLVVYLVTGLAAALCSMYFNLFVIGVGASGAIFGLFGFGLIVNITLHQRSGMSIGPLIVNFVVFLGINILLAQQLNADNAAHIGGVLCGILIGIVTVVLRRPMGSLTAEAIALPVLIIVFLMMPRYQAHYFNLFQKVLEVQDSTNYVLRNSGNKSNEQFLKDYRRVNSQWDTALMILNDQKYIPEELQSDTFKLRKLLKFYKTEGDYRISMVDRESYIFVDSIDIVSDSTRKYNSLKYVLNMKYTPRDTSQNKPDQGQLEMVRIYYDSNWVEIAYPPAAYYRIGQRDSAGLWQGPLQDFYRNGDVQMKGSYKDDLKDGIFIYYRENRTYESAGVYNEDQRVGKWETFHPNGKIESEIFYRDRYFLKSYWDSTGVQMVKDGNGKEIHKYPNGVVAIEGEYVDGYQHGYWYGRHRDGTMYFEENYNRGRLVNGRSRSKAGKTFVYDESTLFALPDGGFKKLNDYIASQTQNSPTHGTVKLSFRVTVSGQLTDFKVEQSASKELDKQARQIILAGPRWLPARLHGQEITDGYAFVSIVF